MAVIIIILKKHKVVILHLKIICMLIISTGKFNRFKRFDTDYGLNIKH